jgi:hypothetical protein
MNRNSWISIVSDLTDNVYLMRVDAGLLGSLPVRKGQEPRGFRGAGDKLTARVGEERRHTHKRTCRQGGQVYTPEAERRIQSVTDRVSPCYLPMQGQPAILVR